MSGVFDNFVVVVAQKKNILVPIVTVKAIDITLYNIEICLTLTLLESKVITASHNVTSMKSGHYQHFSQFSYNMYVHELFLMNKLY